MEKNYNRQNDDIRKTVKNNPKGKKQTVNKKIILILLNLDGIKTQDIIKIWNGIRPIKKQVT